MTLLCNKIAIRQFISHHLTLLITLALSVLVAAFELVLLEVKYGVFRGGFLQSHNIHGFVPVSLFLLALFTTVLLYLAFLEGLFFIVWSRSRIRRMLLVYHFVWLAGGGIILAISARYELTRYFSDFLDFQVAQNLGGGRFGGALIYIFDEGLIYIAAFLSLLAIYLGGHFLIKRNLTAPGKKAINAWSDWFWPIGVALLQAALILQINQSVNIRYHLNHTTAYRASMFLLEKLSDFDRDGFGLFAWQPDSAPFDSAVYPLALDIPGDGIDQDGVGGDFHYQEAVTDAGDYSAPKGMNVLFIVLESARADALEKVIAGRAVMPHLQQLAQEGASASYYYSHEGFTRSSLIALLTAQLAPHKQETNSLFQHFKDAGYQIGVFSGQAETFGEIARKTGMRRYADIYFDAQSAIDDRVFPSTDVGSLTLSNDRVADELFKAGSVDWSKPFFIYMNLQAGHFPYHHAGMPALLTKQPLPRNQINSENRSRLLETYYNAMAYDDQIIGRIIQELKAKNLYDKTLLLISGDHGESLFDDGFLGHGHFINDIQLRTILVASKSLPGMNKPMGQIDVSRALLAFFNSDKPSLLDNHPRVFHFIGTLNHPQLIGMTYEHDSRIVLNLESLEIQTSVNPGDWLPEKVWRQDFVLKSKVEGIVNYWETLRWQDWLAHQKTQGKS